MLPLQEICVVLCLCVRVDAHLSLRSIDATNLAFRCATFNHDEAKCEKAKANGVPCKFKDGQCRTDSWLMSKQAEADDRGVVVHSEGTPVFQAVGGRAAHLGASPTVAAAGAPKDPRLRTAHANYFEFDNGIRINRTRWDDTFHHALRNTYYSQNKLYLHEPFEEAWFTTLFFHAEPGEVFLDVGAAIGYFCLLALRMRPRAAVVAVNPSNYFQRALVENAALQSTPIRVLQLSEEDMLQRGSVAPEAGAILQLPAAVGVSGGRAFMSNPRKQGYGENYHPTNSSDADSVPVLSVQRLVAICGRQVHLAMFDIQGAEALLFESTPLQEVLRTHAIQRIMVGTHGPTHTSVKRALVSAGYHILLALPKVPHYPDGVVVAVAPNVSAELIPHYHNP